MMNKNTYFAALAIIMYTIGCQPDNNTPVAPEPEPPQEAEEVYVPLHSLMVEGELIKDSVWKDSENRTLYLKIGPSFSSSFVGNPADLVPGSILSKRSFKKSEIENLPVTLNFPQHAVHNFLPSDANFKTEVDSYLSNANNDFSRLEFDTGRPFSSYGDLKLINGFDPRPTEQWLTIENRKDKKAKNALVSYFKVVDFVVTMNIPAKGELFDRQKYAQQVEADSLVYINQVYFGKRALLSIRSDMPVDSIRMLTTKLKKQEALTDIERARLDQAEVAYSLFGFGKQKLQSKTPITIIQELHQLLIDTKTAGQPIDFFVRNLKDLSPYTDTRKVDILRK